MSNVPSAASNTTFVQLPPAQDWMQADRFAVWRQYENVAEGIMRDKEPPFFDRPSVRQDRSSRRTS
ncbi:hypothetical protein [Bradyrhizobium canariense]|uniref:hypothetical protein n=1 Tax=Bradyrhizobium canariense TaxID=255045 RepID=UPI0028A0DB48|nr:hypothetical protein [Bradyrhizobium canariense]